MISKILTSSLLLLSCAFVTNQAEAKHCHNTCPSKNEILCRTDAFLQGEYLVNEFSQVFSQLVNQDNNFDRNIYAGILEQLLVENYSITFTTVEVPTTVVTNHAELVLLATAIYNVYHPTFITVSNFIPQNYVKSCHGLRSFGFNTLQTIQAVSTQIPYPNTTIIAQGNYQINESVCDQFLINTAVILGSYEFDSCCNFIPIP